MHLPHTVAIDKWMQTMMLATAHTKQLEKKLLIFIAIVEEIANVIATIVHAQHSVAMDKYMQTMSSAQHIAKNHWN